MTKYRVWEKGIEEKDDAIEIDASDAREAATKWAKYNSFYDDEFEETVVCVLGENDDQRNYYVYAEFVPEFHAHEEE